MIEKKNLQRLLWEEIEDKPSLMTLIYKSAGSGNLIADLTSFPVSTDETYLILLKTYPPITYTGQWILLYPNGITYTGSVYHREIYMNTDGTEGGFSGVKDYAIIARTGIHSHHIIYYFPGFGCITFQDASNDTTVRYIYNYIKFISIPAENFGIIKVEHYYTTGYEIKIYKL